MQIIYKKLDEIHPYENNPRKNDTGVDAVAESIKQYGFKVPIVISKDGTIITGHTRYKASEKLGLNKVPCIVADDLTDEQVKAFRIADNKVSDFSIWDNVLLLQELQEIDDSMFTGFVDGDIFDSVLDESDKSAIENNEDGTIYEIVFKSEDKEKIDKIKELWDAMDHE